VVEKFARRHLLQTWQRPGVPQYTAIEAVLGEEIHAALLKQKSDKEALSNASERIGRILGSDQRFVRIEPLGQQRQQRRNGSSQRNTVAAAG
jgi:hypothetical protein